MISVTRPLLPSQKKYNDLLTDIWDSQWVTNSGPKHQELEAKLSTRAGTNCALYANATLGLMGALAALELPKGSEVITTPFTFAATAHAISWAGLTPVFVDIDPTTLCLCPQAVATAITPKTSAILGVHVYGIACAVEALKEIADQHNLKIIYDAAHAFDSTLNGQPLVKWGDISICSYHATKLFNTIEGGGVYTENKALMEKIKQQRAFGKIAEDTYIAPGLNAKLSELHAAMGLAVLPLVEKERARRLDILEQYKKALNPLGVHFYEPQKNVSHSGQYCTAHIEHQKCGATRDNIHANLAKNDIYARKYFWPLCTDYPHYKNARKTDLTVSKQAVNNTLCLPFYGALSDADVQKVITVIQNCLKS